MDEANRRGDGRGQLPIRSKEQDDASARAIFQLEHAASPRARRQTTSPEDEPLIDLSKATTSTTPLPATLHENLPEVVHAAAAAEAGLEVYHKDANALPEVAPSSASEWAGERLEVTEKSKQRSRRRPRLRLLIFPQKHARQDAEHDRTGGRELQAGGRRGAIPRLLPGGVGGALCQAVWKSRTGRWEAVPLMRGNDDGTTRAGEQPEVKVGTPLSAHVYGSVVEREHAYEYHVFFLDVADRIWELVSADPDDMWRFAAADRLLLEFKTKE